MRRILLAIFLACFVFGTDLRAEVVAAGSGENTMTPIQKSAQDWPAMDGFAAPGLYASIIKTVSALAVILAGMFILLYVLKRFFGPVMGMRGKEKWIRVVASQYIGPKKMIALVEVAGVHLVVGITNSGISLLSRVDSSKRPSKQGPDVQSLNGIFEAPRQAQSRPFTKNLSKASLASESGRGDPNVTLMKGQKSQKPEAEDSHPDLTRAVQSVEASIARYREGWE